VKTHALWLSATKNLHFANAPFPRFSAVDELLVLDNAFALITAAHILTQQTRKENQARYEAKLRLVKILYQRQWDKQRVINLFIVIDWLMKLPEFLDQQVWHVIETIEESEKMQFITSVERIGLAKGRAEGRVEGRVEGELKLLRKQLELRFGALPTWAINKLNSAPEQNLEAWGEAVLTAPTLDAVFEDSKTH
jgi:hypothetical protein